MKKISIMLLILLVVLSTLAGCQKSTEPDLLTLLIERQAKAEQRNDYVAAVTLTLNKDNFSNLPENTQALLNFLPNDNRFDIGITTYQNATALRINGFLSLLDDIRTNFLGAFNLLDIDLDIYIEKDMGIYFKSEHGQLIASSLLPNYPANLDLSNWTQIGDAAAANEFWETYLKLKDQEAMTTVINEALTITDTEKTNDSYSYAASFTTNPYTTYLQEQLDSEPDKLSSWLLNLMEFSDDCCIWENSYQVATDPLKISASSYHLTAQENAANWEKHPYFNDKALDFDILVYRYTYTLDPGYTIKPEELE